MEMKQGRAEGIWWWAGAYPGGWESGSRVSGEMEVGVCGSVKRWEEVGKMGRRVRVRYWWCGVVGIRGRCGAWCAGVCGRCWRWDLGVK